MTIHEFKFDELITGTFLQKPVIIQQAGEVAAYAHLLMA